MLLPRSLTGNGLGTAAEAGGGAHDAGGHCAGVDRTEERALLCRQVARKFDAAAGQRLADVTDAGSLAQVGDWIIKCGTAAELFTRLADTSRRSQ